VQQESTQGKGCKKTRQKKHPQKKPTKPITTVTWTKGQ
jgi:hypothetical protein